MNQINGAMMMRRNNRVTQLFFALLIGLLTISVAAAESPLTQPKADGLIGEQANGYLGLVVEDVPEDIRRLVNDVNSKRKAGYQKIATQQGASLQDVELVGGNTAIEKTLEGNYVRDASGVWRKK
jgi:uncharacterized protein YdbL (DUF1318 family)